MISFESMFQSVGAMYDLVLTAGIHSTQLSVEDRSCLEDNYILSISKRWTGSNETGIFETFHDEKSPKGFTYSCSLFVLSFSFWICDHTFQFQNL